MTSTFCLRIAAISGFLTVALGAFGAHGLKALLTEYNTVDIWDKAVLYQMFHTLALLLLAFRPTVNTGAAMSFLIGICVFSGSLYLLALTNVRWLGAITPLGGLAFLIGWVLLFWKL
ncbi:MAG: DUF423 domain-containing protein [Candidatus Tectomicrobia bacterium]|nr:DUF423 domain-containing protein [Candidatus Tectomicrobia bacterium]